MSDVEYTGNKLTFDGSTTTFPDEITSVKCINDLIIILFEFGGSTAPNNVIALDKDGKEKWVISVPGQKPVDPAPYTGLKINNREIHAYNYNGTRYRVDEEDGSIEKIGSFK